LDKPKAFALANLCRVKKKLQKRKKKKCSPKPVFKNRFGGDRFKKS